MSKITGKQEVVSGFDFDAFVDGAGAPSNPKPKAKKSKPARKVPAASAGRGGASSMPDAINWARQVSMAFEYCFCAKRIIPISWRACFFHAS